MIWKMGIREKASLEIFSIETGQKYPPQNYEISKYVLDSKFEYSTEIIDLLKVS